MTYTQTSNNHTMDTDTLTINGVDYEVFKDGENGPTLVKYTFPPEHVEQLADYPYQELVKGAVSPDQIKQWREEQSMPEDEIKWFEDCRAIYAPLFVGEEDPENHLSPNKIASIMSIPRNFFTWNVFFDGETTLTMDEFLEDEPTVHETDAAVNAVEAGEDVSTHLTRLNNVFCSFWEGTEFYLDRGWKVPFCLHSKNEDGTINVTYKARDEQEPKGSGESLFYIIQHDGTVFCRDSNEVLDLKNIVHIMAVVQTMIRDIYGEYDVDSALQKHIEAWTSKKEAN